MVSWDKYKEKLFETAEIARFTPEQVRYYEDSLKYYRDMKNSLDTAFEEGRTEGREVGRMEGRIEGKIEGKIEGRIEGIIEGREEGEKNKQIEIAKRSLALGLDTDTIVKITGLTPGEINRLQSGGNPD